jgi:phage shock protein PspC (stress-responsive transcriptional regulator)
MPPPASHALRAEAFRRSGDDSMLLGVCAGVGRALGVATVWVRLGALALVAILPALGVLVYALLGVVVRREDGRLALGGTPADSRETVVGWGLVALAVIGATGSGEGFLLTTSSPLLLLACAAAAAVVAQTARRKASRGGWDEGGRPAPAPGPAPAPAAPAAAPERLMLEATNGETVIGTAETIEIPEVEGPTEPGPAAARAAADAPPARAPGPSLLGLGVMVLALVGIAGIFVAPVGLAETQASNLIASAAGVLGILALGGVIVAIAGAGRRHAAGLLVLSLLVGVLALGMASIHDDVGSQPALRWLLERTADLFWIDR